MLSTSKYRVPPLIPALALTALFFLPHAETFGGVPASYRLLATTLFFIAFGLAGWFSTTVKPSRGEAFLSALLCALIFYPASSDNVMALLDQRQCHPAQVAVEYGGVRESMDKDGAGEYFVLANLPGSSRSSPRAIPVSRGLYEQLRKDNMPGTTHLELNLPQGMLGMYSLPRTDCHGR